MKNVTLVLSDGTRFHGESFGYDAPVAGEVVFNTAMMGYPESLTDPSYEGQLLILFPWWVTTECLHLPWRKMAFLLLWKASEYMLPL